MIIFKKSEDLDYIECFNLIKQRIDWMNKNGISHWNKSNYTNVYPLSHYLALQNNGQLFVLKDDKELLAFGALLEEDERWNDKKSAFYLHHLTSKVSYKKYGKKFIIEAIKYAVLKDKKYFRLDSSKDYPKLEDYYKQFGFVECGECIDGNYQGILRQIDLGDKKALRKIIHCIELDEKYVEDASLIIEDKVLNSLKYEEAKNIFVYLNNSKEVKTDLIINTALKDGKKVYVPKCYEDNMEAIEINKNSKFNLNKYGIKEPVSDDKYKGDIDLTIVPCLSAGKDLSRLGHGKGYYDKYLKDHPTFKMILCFDELLFGKLPMDKNDIYMDKLISESI